MHNYSTLGGVNTSPFDRPGVFVQTFTRLRVHGYGMPLASEG